MYELLYIEIYERKAIGKRYFLFDYMKMLPQLLD